MGELKDLREEQDKLLSRVKDFGNKLYLARVDGVVYCGNVEGKGLTGLTENKLEDNIYASPVAIGSHLFIRGRRNLYCFGEK